MCTITLSCALQNAHSQEAVVELINEGSCEGMETAGGTEFTSEMLAGQYAWDAAQDDDDSANEENIDAHLDIIRDAGASFNHSDALAHALKLAAASN